MHTVQFEQIIECTREKLFAFHADPGNLPRITPPDVKVEIIRMDAVIGAGSRAEIVIAKGFLKFRWIVRFEAFDRPNVIIDIAERSPFKYFRHEHRFIPIDEKQTLLRDSVTFELPLEPMSTPVSWFVKHDLKKMFSFRHRVTKQLLEN